MSFFSVFIFEFNLKNTICGILSSKLNIVENLGVVVEEIDKNIYTALTKFLDSKIGYILLYNTEDSC